MLAVWAFYADCGSDVVFFSGVFVGDMVFDGFLADVGTDFLGGATTAFFFTLVSICVDS